MVQSAAIGVLARRNGLQWRRRMLCVLICWLAVPAYAQQVAGQAAETATGSISGSVVDPNSNIVVSARIKLTGKGKSDEQETSTDNEGHFVFAVVNPGAFKIIISAESFAPQEQTGILHPGETLELPPASLSIAAATTEVRVSVTNYELAEEQIKIEETQRVLGVIPNYYVTYQLDTLPLGAKQKFELAWKTSVDPVTFAAAGAFAGIEQAENTYSGYGQGSKGFAKRFGASYADSFIGIMVGGAILPSLLKQDPRYFYKGTGSTWTRIKYAVANAVVCKGDNGRWQVDYSGILGSLAAGGISNLYYPAANRNGVGLTFQNTAISIGGSAIGNLFQEFLVRKLTPHTRGPQAINP